MPATLSHMRFGSFVRASLVDSLRMNPALPPVRGSSRPSIPSDPEGASQRKRAHAMTEKISGPTSSGAGPRADGPRTLPEPIDTSRAPSRALQRADAGLPPPLRSAPGRPEAAAPVDGGSRARSAGAKAGTRRAPNLRSLSLLALAASGGVAAWPTSSTAPARPGPGEAPHALPPLPPAHDGVPLARANATNATQAGGHGVFEDPAFEPWKAPLGGGMTALALGSLAFVPGVAIRLARTRRKDPLAPDAVAPAGPGGAPVFPERRRITGWLKSAVKTTDVHAGLHTGDDLEFRRLATTPADDRITLVDRRAHLVDWAGEIARSDLPANVKSRCRDSIRDTIAAIDDLTTTTRPWARGAALAAQAILATPLSIVLPLFAAPIERQQADVIIASYVKTSMLRFGAGMRGSTSQAVVSNLFMNRDFANVVQSIALSLNLYDRTRAVANHPAYSIGAAAASAGILAYAFYPEQVKALPAQAAHQAQRAFNAATGRPAPARRAQAAATATGLSQDGTDLLAGLHAKALVARAGVKASKEGFEARGNSLTDTADWQFGQILKGYFNVAKGMEDMLGGHAPEGGTRAVVDDDRTAKLILAGLSMAICSGVTAEFYKNKITLVDQGVDLLFNAYNGLNKAFDPNVSWQEALDTFKQWTSLSLIMLPMQGANLLAGDVVEKSDKNMAIGAAILSAANITVAGPTGAAVKWLVGALISRAKADRPEADTALVAVAPAEPPGQAPRLEAGGHAGAAETVETAAVEAGVDIPASASTRG
jgi:hypothetical protein